MRSLTPTAKGRRRRPAPRRPDDPARQGFDGRQWALLAVATVVGAALRLLWLGEWSLWIDEAHTWRDATMPLTGPHGWIEADRVLYPLTFLVLRGLLALRWLGEDAWSLRLPFTLVGIATVPLVALCGRRLVGTWPALLAAALLAVHPWHVYWSQNARGYVVVVAAAAIAANRVLAYVQRERLRDLLGLWGALVVGTLSHPTGVLPAFGFAVFLLLRARPFDRRGLARIGAVLAMGLLALPWMVEWSPYEGFVQSKSASPSGMHFVETAAFYFRPVVMVAATVGLLQLWHAGQRRAALTLACLAAVPLLVMLVVGSTVVLTTARYAICALPMVTWLAAFAAVHVARALHDALPPRTPARWLAVALVPLVLAGEHTAALVDYYTVEHGQRARWSEAGAFLRERAAGRPLRVATTNHPGLLYYLRPGQWRNDVPREFAANAVVPLIHWLIENGRADPKDVLLHEPGAANHLEWHRQAAREAGALFALVVTQPELAQEDKSGELRRLIGAQCELALHLPCWVGPKDDSIYVYLFAAP